MHKQGEAAEQIAVVKWCDYVGVPVFHIPNEGKRSKVVGSILKQMGLRSGVPDLFVPIPKGDYHGLFIEMKYGKNKLTEEQKKWVGLLRDSGYACVVCYSAEKAIAAILNYKKL